MGNLYLFYAAFHQVSKQVKGHVALVKKTMHLTTFWHHLVEPLGDFFSKFFVLYLILVSHSIILHFVPLKTSQL